MANVEFEDMPQKTDFVKFFPWLCYQLQLEVDVFVEKVVPHDIVTKKTLGTSPVTPLQARSPSLKGSRVPDKLAKKASMMQLPSYFENDEKEVACGTDTSGNHLKPFKETAAVYIKAIFDHSHHVVKLIFTKINTNVSQKVFKLLDHVMPQLLYLVNITVKQNISSSSVHELSKLVHMSNITDICLDGCEVDEGNYHVLVEEPAKLKKLSLARCKISDSIVETIAAKMIYSEAASKTLNILNLSSNEITDVGAKHFEKVLRTNRKLYYLSLADNRITDDGARAILNSLLEFPLQTEERKEFTNRHWTYKHKKLELIQKFMEELKLKENENASFSKSNSSSVKHAGKAKGKVKSFGMVLQKINIEEKAIAMAEKELADHEEPFDMVREKETYLYYPGNHSLQMLNLSYNDLTYLTVKKLLQVVQYQRSLEREPIGLLHISIEGNYMPKCCEEYGLIEELLNISNPGKSKSSKKRNSSSARSSLMSK